MASFNRYQSTLSTYNQRLGTADLRNTAPTIEGEYNAKFGSALGQEVGQTLNGFKSITQIQNYPNEFKDVLLGLALVKLTEAVTGENLLEVFDDAFEGIGSGNANVNNVLTAAGALALITGSNPAAGFLKQYYGGSSGLAVGNLLSKATGKDVTSLVSAIQGIQSANTKQFVQAGLSRSISEILGPVISSFNKEVDTAIGTSISPILQAVMDISAGPIGIIIDELTGGKLKSFQVQNIVRLLSEGKYAEAILLTSNNSNSPFSLIESTLLDLDTRVSTRITYTGSSSLPIFNAGSDTNDFEGSNTKTWNDPDGTGSYKFGVIPTEQQLEAEFRSATREITEVVIHWSGTFLDQDIGAKEIHGWHERVGYDGIGYHYVIRKDGTIERGRPIQKDGAHAKVNGHNIRSIGLCLVGGYTVPSELALQNPSTQTGVESYTGPQQANLFVFLRAFYRVWPGGQVFGHSQTDPNKIDPGFPVATYIKNNFKKENLNPGTEQPLTSTQIAELRSS